MSKILIVEDEYSLADMYKVKFKNEGFECLVANSIDQGLDLARQKRPDLILLDILFSIKSGYDMLKELKQDSKLWKVPVVILSNLPEGSVFEPGQKEFLDGTPFLVKARYTPLEVVKFVKNILEKK